MIILYRLAALGKRDCWDMLFGKLSRKQWTTAESLGLGKIANFVESSSAIPVKPHSVTYVLVLRGDNVGWTRLH
jgi:hypothetical protein